MISPIDPLQFSRKRPASEPSSNRKKRVRTETDISTSTDSCQPTSTITYNARGEESLKEPSCDPTKSKADNTEETSTITLREREEKQERKLLETLLARHYDDDGSLPLLDEHDNIPKQRDTCVTKECPDGKQPSVATQLLELCMKHEITSMASLSKYCGGNPNYQKYLIMGRQGAYGQIFEAVKSLISTRSLYDRITFNGCKKEDSRIYNLLKDEQGFTDDRIQEFCINLFMCVERKTGKRNTFAVIGASNSGKSQLMESFCRGYFKSGLGQPCNNKRSTFPWGNCINCRILLWEEPLLDDENFEDFKKIGGGQPIFVDMKYQTHVELEPTPLIITSNTSLTRNLSTMDGSKTNECKNRCFTYYITTPVSDERKSRYFPLCKQDWDDFFSLYEQEITKMNT